ncbi:MAG: hypothetical protein ACJAW8_000728 [Oleispira sp.]|jgi:hypothetical protein|tara:strand:+ start:606 stop:929 length:324 start_codon:yes stop_codon:yes gene_type:complete
MKKYFMVVIALLASSLVAAKTPIIEITIKDHLFYPSELVIPADKKVKLLVINADETAEEFESYELNREKIITGNSKSIIFIGPLPAGRYPFFGEFYPKTAQGVIIAQ